MLIAPTVPIYAVYLVSKENRLLDTIPIILIGVEVYSDRVLCNKLVLTREGELIKASDADYFGGFLGCSYSDKPLWEEFEDLIK